MSWFTWPLSLQSLPGIALANSIQKQRAKESNDDSTQASPLGQRGKEKTPGPQAFQTAFPILKSKSKRGNINIRVACYKFSTSLACIMFIYKYKECSVERVQMISSQYTFLELQVSEINKCAHTNPHDVTIKTTWNTSRRNTQINVSNQWKTYQQSKNKAKLLIQQIMQTFSIQKGKC